MPQLIKTITDMKTIKCYLCEEYAIKRLSPDLDIEGIGYCKEHETDIQIAYIALINEGKDAFDSLMKDLTNKE